MEYILTDAQLEVLIEQKVAALLETLGHIPTHITARAAWRICGGRARFEKLCSLGYIKPVVIDGYKSNRYNRTDVVRAAKGVKTNNNKSKKIQL
jgi:hypothetical protein